MIGSIKIIDYSGFLQRGDKSRLNKVLKTAWEEAGKFFHANLRDNRFTREHALKAGYAPRKGEEAGIGSKAFFRSYTGRKFRKFGHRRPMEFTGDTRRAIAAYASITSTSNGGRVAYPGARIFDYHNPRSDPNMNLNLEFRKILPDEAEQLAEVIDKEMYRMNDSEISPDVYDLLRSANLI